MVVKPYHGQVGSLTLPNRPPRIEVTVSTPWESIKFFHSTNKAMEGCHMAAQYRATQKHVIRQIYATCQPKIHQPSILPVFPVNMLLYLPCHSTVVWPIKSFSKSSLYGLYSHQKFVCFSKQKDQYIFRIWRLFCWVRVIFFACVCVGASDMTTASNDTSY
jgi:hypothetical protein